MDGERIDDSEEISGIGRGYFLLVGLIGGFFITAVMAITVLMLTTAPTAPVAAAPTQPPTEHTGDAVLGEAIYGTVCVACHGTDAGGIEGLGPALAGNEFVAVQSDDDLVGFLTVGRGTDDSANTTGVAMPPRGGNPSLTDDDLYDVVAYLRTLG